MLPSKSELSRSSTFDTLSLYVPAKYIDSAELDSMFSKAQRYVHQLCVFLLQLFSTGASKFVAGISDI
jgi:hypothetical protein